MAANFLHGVETIEINKGPRPIRGVKTAVVGLVGTAPVFEVDGSLASVNRPVLILSDRDAARYFGTQIPGYTIPQALDAVFDQGRGIVVVVNVFDPEIHTSTQAAKDVTFGADDKADLEHQGVFDLVLTDATATTTYVAGTDYTLDPATGIVTRLPGGDITASATIKAGYDYADPELIEPSDIIGAVDVSGNRTGMQAFLDCYAEMGFWPKILIAPVYGTLTAVSAELDVMAGKLRAIALVDAPIGTTRRRGDCRARPERLDQLQHVERAHGAVLSAPEGL